MLDSTLVVATGEFGRTPKINAAGGRDHWPGVWSALLAGGGVQGGQVIGASDAHAAGPADRPVAPQELLATMYHGLGIDPMSVAPPSRRRLVPPRRRRRPTPRTLRLIRIRESRFGCELELRELSVALSIPQTEPPASW